MKSFAEIISGPGTLILRIDLEIICGPRIICADRYIYVFLTRKMHWANLTMKRYKKVSKKTISRLVISVRHRKQFWVPKRNWTSDLRIPVSVWIYHVNSACQAFTWAYFYNWSKQKPSFVENILRNFFYSDSSCIAVKIDFEQRIFRLKI